MILSFVRLCDKFANLKFNSRKCYIISSFAVILCGVVLLTPAYCNGQKGPVVVTEEGIKITQCDVTPEKVTLTWTTEDERITLGESIFKVQARRLKYVRDGMFVSPYAPWIDIAETTGTNFVHEAFTVGETWEYRIAVDITEQVAPEDETSGEGVSTETGTEQVTE